MYFESIVLFLAMPAQNLEKDFIWLRLEKTSQDHLVQSPFVFLFVWFYLLASYVMQKKPAIFMSSLYSSASIPNADVVQESHATPYFVYDSFFFSSLAMKMYCVSIRNGWQQTFYKKISLVYSFMKTISLQKKRDFFSFLKIFLVRLNWVKHHMHTYSLG